MIGYDFALGRGREGNPERLQAIGQSLGYEVILTQPIQAGEQPISSSQIRHLIQLGDLETANQWLGRRYAIEGSVVRGDGRGRVLGFPTANLSYWPEKLLPANGVYATWAWVGKERLAAVTNLGVRPTFASPLHYRFLEAHILDFNGDLYQQTLTLEFVARLRPEQRFSSLEELKAQIQKDIRTAREILNHVPERQVYLLDPQFLPPETIAVTFAKTSRSPQSFRDIAAELTAEKSAAFHEKWVVGYGHASVAEHAVLHIAVENASRLAIETLESCRLASFTEKSTRYQKWGPEDFFHPPELAGHPLEKRYLDTCHALFEHYHQALPKVREVIAGEYPRQPDEDEAAWERRIRSKYVDVCRFYLPAAALANVGVTINARALEHTLRKMLSHPLEEVRALGAEIKGVARTVVPTLVKYAETVPYLQTLPSLLAQEVAGTPHASDDWCHLITWDAEAETLALAACLFRYSHLTFEQARDKVAALSVEERTALFQRILGGLDRFTPPIRELEHVGYTFEVTLDQGGISNSSATA